MPLNYCPGCGTDWDDPLPGIFCSPRCQQKVHRALKPPPPRPKTTLSVSQAWATLADAAAGFNDDYETTRISDMLIKVALAKPGSSRTARTAAGD
jgi:hypothetical protein